MVDMTATMAGSGAVWPIAAEGRTAKARQCDTPLPGTFRAGFQTACTAMHQTSPKYTSPKSRFLLTSNGCDATGEMPLCGPARLAVGPECAGISSDLRDQWPRSGRSSTRQMRRTRQTGCCAKRWIGKDHFRQSGYYWRSAISKTAAALSGGRGAARHHLIMMLAGCFDARPDLKTPLGPIRATVFQTRPTRP